MESVVRFTSSARRKVTMDNLTAIHSSNGLQSTLQRDIAHARLQLAITQALCAYIEETNMPECVGLTQIDFEHHGARVCVRMEMGEAIVKELEIGGEKIKVKVGSKLDGLTGNWLLVPDGETCKAGCQRSQKESVRPSIRLHSPDCGTKFRGCSPDCEQRMFEDLDDKLFDFVESVSGKIEDKEIEGIRQQSVGYLSGLRDRLNGVYAKRIESKSSQKT